MHLSKKQPLTYALGWILDGLAHKTLEVRILACKAITCAPQLYVRDDLERALSETSKLVEDRLQPVALRFYVPLPPPRFLSHR